MELADILARVRMEIGDPPQAFRSTGTGDGQAVLFDLPKQELCESSLSVEYINGAATTVLADYTHAAQWSSTTAYATGAQAYWGNDAFTASQASTGQQPAPGGTAYWNDVTSTAYLVNSGRGKITLGSPVPLNATLIISGTSWSLFSDHDLVRIILESVAEHTFAQETEERYRDSHGFIDYRETSKTLANLPFIEEPLVVTLSVLNVFWALASDAATDTDVQTAEGTVINRTARYGQIMRHIDSLTSKYMLYCGQLNVGMFRMETLDLRRTSRTTGRLVPLFKSREFDDHRWPTRLIPPIDHRNDDFSGVPTPLWSPSWGT
jgi:hypothetical protein